MTKSFSTPREIFSNPDPTQCTTCPSEQVSAWATMEGANAMETIVEAKVAQDKRADWPCHEPLRRSGLGRLGLRDSSY